MLPQEGGLDPDLLLQDEGQLIKGLTWTQRIQGFLIFVSLGFFANMMGYLALGMGVYWKYTVLTTMGSIISTFSTMILMGPMTQLQSMMDERRRGATLLYFGTLIMSLILAFSFKSLILCALCGFLQYLALFWYSLSYIPYGQNALLVLIFGE
ncbi:unnamed protein product [Phytomonas sp. Hart1]|nr:unnamed protein product [Phytomonas sp. Hart1]|eukprot:CCW70833.1 unnamed protein product [Phytomonas sp. isolate Hart1]